MLDLTQIEMATGEGKAYGIDTWARIFKAKTWEKLRMAVENNEYMEETVETMYTLNADKMVRQQCEARRRAEIEGKYLHDEMERLTKGMDKLAKDNAKLSENNEKLLENNAKLSKNNDKLLENNEKLRQESERWKEKYEKLLAEQKA